MSTTTVKPISITGRLFGSRFQFEPGSTTWFFSRDRVAYISFWVLVAIILIALLAPIIAPYPEQGQGIPNIEDKFSPPSSEHWMGTDQLGRDILSRIIYGARTALIYGVAVVAFSAVLGSTLGAIAGYFGGRTDEIIMRITDIFLTFPPLLLAIVIASVLDRGMGTAILALALTWWPWYARIVRGQAISVRERDYVKAARGLGVSDTAIVRRHILPNVLTPVIIQATLDVGAAILTASGLSFLGLGTQPPTADWGVMISEGRGYMQTGYWWIATFAGLAIFVTTLACNLMGDGVQIALDPHQRGK